MANEALDRLQSDVCEWAEDTFPEATLDSTLAHLRDELDEVSREPLDVIEWADVLLIVLHGSRRFGGHEFSEIVEAAYVKFAENKLRSWGEPDERGVVRHVPPASAGE